MYTNNPVVINTPSGKRYIYDVYLITGTIFKNVPGNYMFAYQIPNGLWQVLYVGQTSNFASRMSNHEKLGIAIKNGATHILAHVNNNEIARINEEFEMINYLQPALNELLKYQFNQ